MRKRAIMSRLAVARLLGVRSSTLKAWVNAGVGPLPNRWGRYSHPEVVAWVEEVQYAVGVANRPL